MKLVLGLLAIAYLVNARSAFAECEKISITVRTVRASQPIDGTKPHRDASDIDQRITDLTPQLRKLHYRSYKLVSRYQDTVEMRKKDVMKLEGGDLLTLRPYAVDHGRIGLWLKWIDPHGMEVLDTRMHFVPGESMLTGTDSSGDSGTILAIDVKPVE